MAHVFIIFLYHFGIFYWTNLLTRCPVPVSVYYVCALQKRSKIQSARKIPKKIRENLFRQKTPGAIRTSPGEAHSLQTAPGRGPGSTPPRPHLGATSTTPCHLFAYIFTPDLKMRERRRFSPETHLSSAATKNPNSGVKRSCSGTLPGWGLTPGAISFDYAASMMLRE